MLVPMEMKNLIKQKMEENGYPNTQEDSVLRLSKGIGEYISNNVEIIYSWTAQTTSTPPVTDPVVSFTTDVSYNNSSIGLFSSLEQFYTNLNIFLHNNLSINIPTGFSLPLIFIPSGLVSISLTSDLNSFDTAMLSFCTQLITTFKTNYLNTTFIPGNRIETYYGNAVMISIN